jgi:hypothetical protein
MDESHDTRGTLDPLGNRDRFSIRAMLFLVVGVGIGLAVTRPIWSEPYKGGDDADPITIVPVAARVVVAVLSGLSFIGVPLLLSRRTGRRTPWGPGRIAWFAQGTAAWLLWPPVVYYRLPLARASESPSWSSVCWLWGTPLMGLYITAAILAGGWLGRRGRRMINRSWREQFGLILSGLWACTGLYFLGLLYWIDVFRKP